MFKTLLFVVLATLATGCFGMPPIRAGAGAGGGGGNVIIRNRSNEIREHKTAGIAQLRVAFTPLVLPKWSDARRLDLGFGWSGDWQSAGGNRHDFRHGIFAEGAWFIKQFAPVQHQRWRYGPTALAELRFAVSDDEHDGERGWGAGAGFLAEYADSVRGPFFAGGWKGEMALGLAARVGLRHVDGGTHAYGIVSIEFRLPGVAGFAIPVPNHRNALVQ
jgi:hypothetical protein